MAVLSRQIAFGLPNFWSGFLQFKAQSRGAAGAHAEMRQQLVRALDYVKIRLRADFHGGGS